MNEKTIELFNKRQNILIKRSIGLSKFFDERDLQRFKSSVRQKKLLKSVSKKLNHNFAGAKCHRYLAIIARFLGAYED
ncbi:hypothetical protein BpHYR1_017657 [Brachionus plicatilis]|uniref:Uncharacterized protein n=1 Tax=Brachionus plicatilis TaxID=10195 RepID=A0A3M7Q818_BRAPC|nr:hypothetical protein BpHYR1_017657 [Brachionus plicatilis]